MFRETNLSMEGRKIMARIADEIQDVKAVLGEAEIERRIGEMPSYNRRRELVNFTDDGMTPEQFHAWADLASKFPDATMSGNTIWRPKTHEELVSVVVENEYNNRTRWGQQHPACTVEELLAAADASPSAALAAGLRERADALLREYGDQARTEYRAQYVSEDA
jgi:hypothetical protein